jgi:hypothetical protein
MSLDDLTVVIAFSQWLWRSSRAKLIGSVAALHGGKVNAEKMDCPFR